MTRRVYAGGFLYVNTKNMPPSLLRLAMTYMAHMTPAQQEACLALAASFVAQK